MGLQDPQMRVGTSGTSPALGRNYATNAATAGRVLTSQGDNLPPLWAAPGGGGVKPVERVLFVDAVNFGAVPDGTLSAPFATIQAAINFAAGLLWDTVQLQLATAVYADPVNIPQVLTYTSLVSWDTSQNVGPVLGGDITVTADPLLASVLSIIGCDVSAANIATANPATQDLTLLLSSTFQGAAVNANNVYIELFHSEHGGNISGTASVFTAWDGWSWARTLQANPVISPGYSRLFLDAGHDTYNRSLVVNGLAIGNTAFVTMAVSTGAFVRTEDQAQVKVVDPAIQDFICGVHGVGPGSVTCWIRNLSRVSTNFNEAIQILIHHNNMVAEPAP
jgi:hypothetical protein